MPPRLSGFKVFWPGVEIALKIGLAVVMVVVILLPLAWGYRQHAEAELWRDVACSYRLKEALRERLITPADLGARPCTRLDQLGLTFEPSSPFAGPRVIGARALSTRHSVWPSASVSE
jgi:hypothetical protein